MCVCVCVCFKRETKTKLGVKHTQNEKATVVRHNNSNGNDIKTKGMP